MKQQNHSVGNLLLLFCFMGVASIYASTHVRTDESGKIFSLLAIKGKILNYCISPHNFLKCPWKIADHIFPYFPRGGGGGEGGLAPRTR